MDIEPHIFEQALNSANDGIVITDNRLPGNPIVFVNEAFENLTGYTKEEILNRNCRFLQGSDTNQLGLEVIRKATSEGKPCRVDLRNYRKEGTLFWNELSVAPICNQIGEVTHFVGIQKDITKQKKQEAVLFSQVKHDPLTRLYNRRGFFMEIRGAIAIARRLSKNLIFVLIDIDNFKTINDCYGHSAGDQVLTTFSTILQATQRETDIIARFGGDEFTAVMFENDEFDYDKWRQGLENNYKSLNLIIPFSISMGRADIPFSQSKSLSRVIQEADANMYQEKEKHHRKK